MAALLVALLFTTAFAVSIWSIWITVAPRLPYMRALLAGQGVPPLVPAVAPRSRMARAALPAVQGIQRRLAA